MAITAMGLGSKSLEGDFNLDPQQQFWSFLSGMVPHGSGIYSDSTRGVIFSGFYVRPTDPAGLSVRIGRDASTERTPDSAYCGGDLSNPGMATLLSTDGTPEVVDIPSAPSSGTYTYDIVSVFMPATLVATADQTAGTPELVKTFAVTGASGGIPSASEINAAAPTGAYTGYVRWARVTVKAGQTTITADDIKQLDGDDIADSWMRRSHGLLYSDSITFKHETRTAAFDSGITVDYGRYGSICLVTLFGPTRNAMASSGSAQIGSPTWLTASLYLPRGAGSIGNTVLNMALGDDGVFSWSHTGDIPAGSFIFANMSWVTSTDRRAS